jgi:hypothetical protein
MSEDYDNPMLREAENEVARYGGRQTGADAAEHAGKQGRSAWQFVKDSRYTILGTALAIAACVAIKLGTDYLIDQHTKEIDEQRKERTVKPEPSRLERTLK